MSFPHFLSSSLRNCSLKVTVLLVLFVSSLLIIVLLGKSAYSAASCPNLKPSVQIIDEWGEASKVKPFSNYVEEVSDYITTTACKAQRQKGQVGSFQSLELIFVYRPRNLYSSETTSVYEQALTQPNVSRFLDSPWVRMTIGQSKLPILRGVFLWNERQFASDQTLIYGTAPPPREPLLSIDSEKMEGYIKDYQHFFLSPQPSVRRTLQMTEEQYLEAVQASIATSRSAFEKAVPPDIFWLLRNAIQSTSSPPPGFVGADNPGYIMLSNMYLMENALPGYMSLTKALTKQFLNSAEPQIYYRNLLDLKTVFNIEKYRVKVPLFYSN
jgi:hypothetical protein